MRECLALSCLMVLASTACINRPGMNLDCRWPHEEAFRAQLANPAHVRHLLNDIEVANELTIRYRDEKRGRQPRPVLGIQFRTRGSAGPSGEWGEQCQRRLMQAIVDHHGVQPADIAALRPRLAERGLDLFVSIPVLLLFCVLAPWALCRIRSRFADDERLARGVALIIVPVAIGVAIAVAGGFWSALVEIIRVGNEHLANRAALIAWPARAPAVFVLSVIVFWLLAFTTRHRSN